VSRTLTFELSDVSRLVDAATVADKLGVSRAFIYDHAQELGVIRLGSGEKARLRFDLERVLAAVGAAQTNDARPPRPTTCARTKRRTETTASGLPLLPIKERTNAPR